MSPLCYENWKSPISRSGGQGGGEVRARNGLGDRQLGTEKQEWEESDHLATSVEIIRSGYFGSARFIAAATASAAARSTSNEA